MARAVRLRRWQKAALDQLDATERPDFLAVATPGAGKTTFALAATVRFLADRPGRRAVVVVPTSHLKVQWADAAAGLGLHLDPTWSARQGDPPGDVHGVVVTYQQVVTSAAALARVARGAMVVFDEVHHAGDDRAWGDALRAAFGAAARRLSISGTPFRSDQQQIPFVSYDLDEATADYVYGYADALADGGVVRPVYFPRRGGQMEWTAPDGALHHASFDDALDTTLASQRLRTALSPEGQWLRTVLAEADEQLRRCRETHADAGGLVICVDVDHARAIAGLLTELTGTPPVVAVSDDPDASDRIAAFATSDTPWIVAVRMVSEGVDVPRLRVGVFATTTTTELFFRQAVGRLVRHRRGQGRQRAWMFLPDDPRLRLHAARIAEDRRHSLRRRPEREPDEEREAALDPQRDEQMSLFQALAATPASPHDDLAEILRVDEGVSLDDHDANDDPALVLQLPIAPLADGTVPLTTTSHRQSRADLRRANADRVQLLVNLTGRGHRDVNAVLNRDARVRSIDGASVRELERRLALADRWIARA